MEMILILLLIIVLIKGSAFGKGIRGMIKEHVVYVISVIGIVATALFLSDISKYIEHLTEFSGGTGSILSRDLEDMPANLKFIFSNYLISGILGIGGYTSSMPGMYFRMPLINELHFLLDIFYALGIVGFIIFWSIFIRSAWTCWRAFAIKRVDSANKDLYLSGFFICLLFMMNIVHYAPMGLSNIFIIAFIPLLALFANKELKIHSK